MFKIIKTLKRKIEEEIVKINNTQKNIEEKIELSFKKRHEKLIEEEQKLKLELNIKINEIKGELKEYLRKSNTIISSGENIHKAIENYQNLNNEIKTLCYISELNKSEETIKDFLKERIKNLNISINFDSSLNYENYYFNGIPIPKDVKVEREEDKIFVSWDIDDSLIKNSDMNNMKFSVIIKGSLFDSIYETKDKYIYINKYFSNKEYEIKVRTSIAGCHSDWSNLKKIKFDRKEGLNPFENNEIINGNQKDIIPNNDDKNEGLINRNNNNQRQKIAFDKANDNYQIISIFDNENIPEKSIFENNNLFEIKNPFLLSKSSDIFNLDNKDQRETLFQIK